MKLHKQAVSIDAYNGLLEVVSFYDSKSKSFGADIFFEEKLLATHREMKNEPLREHLLSLGYYYVMVLEKANQIDNYMTSFAN